MPICTKCNHDKPEQLFYPGRSKHCKLCRNRDSTRWRQLNRNKSRLHSAKSQSNKRLQRKQIIDNIKDVPCLDCGVKYPSYVMHFDRVPERGEKIKDIAGMLTFKEKTLMREVDKCDIVCANCLAERTHQRKQN